MKKKLSSSNYSFYATLLDGYQSYADAEQSYERYYGKSEEPSISEDEWEEKLRQDFINRINRVPFESEATTKGTQFNNVIDFFVNHIEETDEHKMWIDDNAGTVSIADKAVEKDEEGKESEVMKNYFTFPLKTVKDFAEYYDGALCQQFCKGTIDTKFGDVDLYGYIDYLLPFSIHDLKTTKYYGGAGSFRSHFQHLVYPFCLHQMGVDINTFEYNILAFNNGNTYTESYEFSAERDIPRIREQCENIIRFLEANKEIITDLKVFNLKEVENE